MLTENQLVAAVLILAVLGLVVVLAGCEARAACEPQPSTSAERATRGEPGHGVRRGLRANSSASRAKTSAEAPGSWRPR